jgi:cytochrome P450
MTTHAAIYYDPYDYEIDVDPHPIWRRMREEQPLYWNERYGFWALSRFEDVWAAYHDTTTFSSAHGVQLETLDAPIEHASMIFMDPPEHDRLRTLVSRAFTPRRIRDLEVSITALVDGYLDAFTGAEQFDYVEQFGALVPPMVIGELLGVPAEDREEMRHWFDDMLHRDEDSNGPSERAIAAGLATFEYMAPMIAERRRTPRDDLVTALIEAEIDEDGRTRRLDEHEVMLFVTLLAGAGVETVARLLSWAAVVLARYPDQRALLVDDPSLVPNGIEELLRFEAPSPVNGRWVTRPFEVHGTVVPAESKILMLNGSANRDPREFDDPDRFDVRRAIKRHITFGYGAHFCLGAALARLEGRIALARTLPDVGDRRVRARPGAHQHRARVRVGADSPFLTHAEADRSRQSTDPPSGVGGETRQSPVEGSMTVATLLTRSAGKPPQRACSKTMSSSGAT